MITAILDAARIEAQAYATCNNILSRGKHKRDQLEHACQLIHQRGLAPSYTSVRTMMQAIASGAETSETKPPTGPASSAAVLPTAPPARGGHLRGPEHFRTTSPATKEDC